MRATSLDITEEPARTVPYPQPDHESKGGDGIDRSPRYGQNR